MADIFRVRGGTRHDYVFHGPGNDFAVDGPPAGARWPSKTTAYELRDVARVEAAAAWKITWKVAPDRHFSALWFNGPGETTLLGTGWGQLRDYRNTDVGRGARRTSCGGARQDRGRAFLPGCSRPLLGPGQAICRGVICFPSPQRRGKIPRPWRSDRSAVRGLPGFQPPAAVGPGANSRRAAGKGRARLAAVSIRQGKVAFSSLVEGNVLRWKGKNARVPDDSQR